MLVTATMMANVILYGSYTMWLMMPYLTKVWGLSITRAAAVINIFDGVVAILPLGLKITVDSLGVLAGDFWMLLLCGLASTVGLGLVTMSTPPILAKVAGTCSKYEPKCIGHVQRGFFYAGLALLAIGMASCITSLRPYIFERAKRMGIRKPKHFSKVRQALVHKYNKMEDLQQALRKANSNFDPKVLRNIAYHWPSEHWLYQCNGTFLVILVVLVFWVMPWPWRLGIPVMILALATLLFLTKSWYDTSVTQIQGVLSSTQTNVVPLWTQVQNITRTMMVTLPIWLTFIICGLVSSVGNTYFIEQANQMDPKLGNWKVPTAFFLLFYKVMNLLVSKQCKGIIMSSDSYNPSNKRPRIHAAIGFSLVISITCCIIAALVERKRLYMVEKHGLIDKPDETTVPLSMFLMLPQFFLLAVLDGAFNCSVFAFFQDRSPKVLRPYMNAFMHFVLGLGILCNVLSVNLAGRVSGRGRTKSWFQHTLNRSRLDKYYWLLSVLSAINLVCFSLVAMFYKYDECSEVEPPTEQETGEVEPLEFKRLDWFDLLPLRQ